MLVRTQKKVERKMKHLKYLCTFWFYSVDNTRMVGSSFEARAPDERRYNINERIKNRRNISYSQRVMPPRSHDKEKKWQQQIQEVEQHEESFGMRYRSRDILVCRCTSRQVDTDTVDTLSLDTIHTKKIIISETNSYLYYLSIGKWRAFVSSISRESRICLLREVNKILCLFGLFVCSL